ncbi:G-type lectin S-receptor-like serine/threonine-protein kinase LECRK3 [Citrus sinensis]|nr:G-type lectin S-receptor-like serine/threonine-protein kinase LECRK3 [Citrus sinensis]
MAWLRPFRWLVPAMTFNILQIVTAMASAKFYFIFLLFLFPYDLHLAIAQTNGTVPVGSTLTAGTDSSPWLSPSGDFTFGFHQLVVVGHMNDTGNFVIASSSSSRLWDSFSNPTDTLLPGKMMETEQGLFSGKSDTNFSRGRFQFRLLKDSNLVLNIANLPTDLAYDAYYISGTYDSTNSSNSGYQVMFNESGYMYILRRNGRRFDLTTERVVPAADFYHRATLNFDGVFVQSFYLKNGNGNWSVVWSQPENICVNIGGELGSGAYGFNSICPKGYSLLDENEKYGSCKADFELSYYELSRPYDEVQCKNNCLSDCFCVVAIFRGDSCWSKKLPLSNGRAHSSVNGKAFLKYKKGDDPDPPSVPSPPDPEDKKKRNMMNVTRSVLLGSSVFVNFTLKLDRVFQDGEKEFKNEVVMIGQTYHKNLVRLLGFCDEGQNRLLVYKFLNNGTLASFLFENLKPGWNLRANIAFQIARGLLHLHVNCSSQIIHCDIKPQNILLDDYYNAQISDFGLAKLLTLNQSKAIKKAIRGTKGYVACHDPTQT